MPSQWTPNEDQLIVDNYPLGGYKVVKDLLPHRSRSGIVNRASRLGVKGREWTEEDDQVIQHCYPRFGAEYCLKYMPWRTVVAIQSRACVLGLKRNRRYMGVEISPDSDWMLAQQLVRRKWA